MNKIITRFLLLLTASATVASCSDDCGPQTEPNYEQTFRLAIEGVQQESVIDDFPAYVEVDIYTIQNSSPRLSYDSFFTFISTPKQLSLIGIGKHIFYGIGCFYNIQNKYGNGTEYQTIWIVAEEGTYRIHLKLEQPILNKFYITPEYDLTMHKDQKGKWSAELKPVA